MYLCRACSKKRTSPPHPARARAMLTPCQTASTKTTRISRRSLQVYQILPTHMKRGGVVLSFPPTAECLDRDHIMLSHVWVVSCFCGCSTLALVSPRPTTSIMSKCEHDNSLKRPQCYYLRLSPTNRALIILIIWQSEVF